MVNVSLDKVVSFSKKYPGTKLADLYWKDRDYFKWVIQQWNVRLNGDIKMWMEHVERLKKNAISSNWSIGDLVCFEKMLNAGFRQQLSDAVDECQIVENIESLVEDYYENIDDFDEPWPLDKDGDVKIPSKIIQNLDKGFDLVIFYKDKLSGSWKYYNGGIDIRFESEDDIYFLINSFKYDVTGHDIFILNSCSDAESMSKDIVTVWTKFCSKQQAVQGENLCQEIPLGMVQTCTLGVNESTTSVSKSPIGQINIDTSKKDVTIKLPKYPAGTMLIVGTDGELKELTNGQSEGNKQMNAVKNATAGLVDQNKQALLLAGKIEAGNVAITMICEKVGAKLPAPLGMFKDHPLFQIAMANATIAAVNHFAPNHKNANALTDAMLVASMQKLVQSFNIGEMVQELLDGVVVPTPKE